MAVLRWCFVSITRCFRMKNSLNKPRVENFYVFLSIHRNLSSVNAAQLLSGTELSKHIKGELMKDIKLLKAKRSDFEPKLAIVQVGQREDSNIYIRRKKKVASDVGVVTDHIRLSRESTEYEILSTIKKLNEDCSVHGIIVQLPLDTVEPVDSNTITNAIIAEKDVEGITDENTGKLCHGLLKGFIPCTPLGCLELIKKSGVSISGSRVVVIGRSKIVGMPMAQLLLWHHATVTICHSRTRHLKSICQQADILVVAVGQAKMVKGDWIKPGVVIVDCGINQIPDSSKKSGYRLIGDVDFDEARKIASFITPVPGGVGPMTVIMLVKNTFEAARKIIG